MYRHAMENSNDLAPLSNSDPRSRILKPQPGSSSICHNCSLSGPSTRNHTHTCHHNCQLRVSATESRRCKMCLLNIYYETTNRTLPRSVNKYLSRCNNYMQYHSQDPAKATPDCSTHIALVGLPRQLRCLEAPCFANLPRIPARVGPCQ